MIVLTLGWETSPPMRQSKVAGRYRDAWLEGLSPISVEYVINRNLQTLIDLVLVICLFSLARTIHGNIMEQWCPAKNTQKSGWWFQTWLLFSIMGCHPSQLTFTHIFQDGYCTTNQYHIHYTICSHYIPRGLVETTNQKRFVDWNEVLYRSISRKWDAIPKRWPEGPASPKSSIYNVLYYLYIYMVVYTLILVICISSQ